jgi:hypothetical protein
VLLARPALPVPEKAAHAAMDRDLTDVTVDRLNALYREHRYTFEQEGSCSNVSVRYFRVA